MENSLIFLIVNNVFKGNCGFVVVLYYLVYLFFILYWNILVFVRNSFLENIFVENGVFVMWGYGGYDFVME